MVAFEPQPFVFQNLNGIHNVRAWPYACGAHAEAVYFGHPDYSRPGNFGAVSMQEQATPG